MATTPTASPPTDRAQGRVFFWAGLGLCLLGLALLTLQFSLKYLVVPWYSPALASIGGALLLLAVLRRSSIFRVVTLVLVVAFAGCQWYFFAVLTKLPDYAGPARTGEKLPAFTTTLAAGRSFSNADLQDGSRRVLVFFRGRW